MNIEIIGASIGFIVAISIIVFFSHISETEKLKDVVIFYMGIVFFWGSMNLFEKLAVWIAK